MDETPPVLADPLTRERYDTTWSLYPWEHPAAYWLRANEQRAVCTRCGSELVGETLDLVVLETEFAAWVAVHLACPLGFGLDGKGERAHDPLFSEGTE